MSMRHIQIGIAVVLAVAVVALFFIFNPFAVQNTLNPLDTTSTAGTGSLVAQDEVAGAGPGAQPGDMVTVNYTGTLPDGTVFDTSVGKTPYTFILGHGDVIAGWDQGLVGMQAGGKRVLIIPASLAYGASGYGPIPPNTTLTFEVEMVKITPASQAAPLPEGEFAE